MGFSKLVFVLFTSLLVGSLAEQVPGQSISDHKGHDPERHEYARDCLTDSEARFLVDTFNYFFIHLDPALVEKYMVPEFHEYSDSFLSLFMNGSVSRLLSG